jgi:hypothetical protein
MKPVHLLVLLVVVLAGYLLMGSTWWSIFRSIWWNVFLTVAGVSGVIITLFLRLGMLKSGGIWGVTPLGALLIALGLLAGGVGGLYPVLDWLVPIALVLVAIGLWMEAKARKARQHGAPHAE